MTTLLSIMVGTGLAASAGFRIFVPLLALNLAARFDVIPLQENWAWIGSEAALIVFAIATLVEAVAYLIPWLDNILDVIATPAAAAAGTLIVIATMADMDPVFSWTLAIIAGGGTAAALKTTHTGARAVSTATTGGTANPILSVYETSMSSVLSVLSVFTPIIAFIIVVILFFVVRKIYRRLFKKKRTELQSTSQQQ